MFILAKSPTLTQTLFYLQTELFCSDQQGLWCALLCILSQPYRIIRTKKLSAATSFTILFIKDSIASSIATIESIDEHRRSLATPLTTFTRFFRSISSGLFILVRPSFQTRNLRLRLHPPSDWIFSLVLHGVQQRKLSIHGFLDQAQSPQSVWYAECVVVSCFTISCFRQHSHAAFNSD